MGAVVRLREQSDGEQGSPEIRLIYVLGRMAALDEIETERWERHEEKAIEEFLLMAEASERPKHCLNPLHSDREAYSRGLCNTCHNAACKLVKAGKITWDTLEAAGKALPPSPRQIGGVKGWLLAQ